MSGHLPECYRSEDRSDTPCICDRLRACSNRVQEEAQTAVAGIPYTEIDGYPFVLRQEAISSIEAQRGHQ